jgi:hypothetical protein
MLRQFHRFVTVRQTVQMESIPVIMEADVGLVHGIKVIVELCHNSFFVQDTLPRGKHRILARLAKICFFGKKYWNT